MYVIENILTVGNKIANGQTPYELVKGRKFAMPLCSFGEKCTYKILAKSLERGARSSTPTISREKG